MLNFLFAKKENHIAKDLELNAFYEKLKQAYSFDEIPE